MLTQSQVLNYFPSLLHRGVATYNANESMDSEPAYSNFITSDRSGRRNAVHELQGDATALSLQKLVGSMEDVAIEGGGELYSSQCLLAHMTSYP